LAALLQVVDAALTLSEFGAECEAV